MKRCLLSISIFCFCCHLLHAEKVLIITPSYNRPDFIEMQYKTFKKFLKDDYEFVVFNDARVPTLSREIERTCTRLGVRCIKIPQHIHNQPYLRRWPGEDYNSPSVRNANAIQYALNTIGYDHPGIVVLIDSDMFLIRETSIEKILEAHDLCGLIQSRKHITYLWIGLVFLRMPALPDKRSIDFNCGLIDGVGVDAGGQTYHYLQQQSRVKLLWGNINYLEGAREHFASLPGDDPLKKFLNCNPDRIEFLMDYRFVHYGAGTNWDYKSTRYHDAKTRAFHEFINAITGSA